MPRYNAYRRICPLVKYTINILFRSNTSYRTWEVDASFYAFDIQHARAQASKMCRGLILDKVCSNYELRSVIVD